MDAHLYLINCRGARKPAKTNLNKNELNLTNRYRDMVPDRQKVWTDGRNGRRQNFIPPTSSGDNNRAVTGAR